MRLFRELGRRKLRTGLTILGITIGIWALVVFSSMANKIDALVDGGSTYYEDKLVVTDASGSLGGFATAPISMATADRLRLVDGVAAAAPQVMLLMDDQMPTMAMGVPPMIGAEVAGANEGLETFELRYADGRGLTGDDEGTDVTVLGSDIARKFDMQVGDTMLLKGRPFEVVGILEPTLTAPDQEALVPMRAAQELFVETLPEMLQPTVVIDDVTTTIVVYPEPGVDPESLADRIEAEVPNVATMTVTDFDEQIGSATAIFNAIIIGVAIISLVVGGLSVINTMAMSVAERTREIGIKRAIGGPRGRIVRELVTEAGFIGLLGGLIGLGLGALVVVMANEVGRESGTVLFQLTPGTAIFALAFSTGLGMLAGIIPAWHAAQLDPVSALRYE